MSQRDTIDSAEFDPAVFGDVLGPNVVAPAKPAQPQTGDEKQEFSAHAKPAPTKRISKTGGTFIFLLVAGVAMALVTAIVTTKEPSSGDTVASAEEKVKPTVGAAAPNFDAKLGEAAGGPLGASPNNTGGADGTGGQANAASSPTQQAAPTPREQYREWLEKHRYDRLRARHVAEDQAHTAKLVDDGDARLADARARVAAAAQAQAAASQVPTQSAGAAGVPPSILAAARPAVAQQLDETARIDARREAFAQSSRDVGYLDADVRDKRAGNEIAAGTIIPAVMLTAINSDLPGSIVAQVRSDVYDTFNYRVKLIPAGSRLVGRYSSEISYGQERVLVAWDELIFPNGRRIALLGQSGADAQGASGMKDQVNTHFWRTWGNALLVSLIGAAAQQAQPQNAGTFNTPTASQQATAAAANSLNDTASQVLRKNLNVSPTLEVRPGYLFNVLVNKSVSLPPYKD